MSSSSFAALSDAQDMTPAQVIKALELREALRHRCPWCKAPVGDQCTRAGEPGRGRVQLVAGVHPSRLDAA